MNFNLKSVSLALLAAVSLSIPFVAHADDNSTKVQLAVESVCGAGANVIDIRNTGFVTSSVLRYRLVARASEVMPPLRTWNLMLMPIPPGQVLHLTAPRGAFGLKLTVEIAADANTVVTQSRKSIAYPSFCW